MEQLELFQGGFPCQPFSIAGKRKGKEDDRDLWPEMFRIIEEIRPHWVVGENVANFVEMELDRTLFDLESIGYKGQSFVIPACAVNAKHKRERTFIVAYSDNGHEFKNKEIFTRRDAFRNGNPVIFNAYSESEHKTDKSSSAIRSSRQTWKGSTRESWREASRTYWKTNKPPICGVVNGISKGLDKSRLKSLGNAVVPQQIYPIFKAIMEIEGVMNERIQHKGK